MSIHRHWNMSFAQKLEPRQNHNGSRSRARAPINAINSNNTSRKVAIGHAAIRLLMSSLSSEAYIISLFRSVYQICTRNVCTISEVLKSKPFETHFVKKHCTWTQMKLCKKNEPVLSRVILFAITDRRTDGTQIKTMLAARDTPRGVRARCIADRQTAQHAYPRRVHLD